MQTLQVYKSLLIQAKAFYDPHSTSVLTNIIKSRFHKSRTITDPTRLKHNINTALKFLQKLRRANHADLKSLTSILELVYRQRGALRYFPLRRVVTDPPFPGARVTNAGAELLPLQYSNMKANEHECDGDERDRVSRVDRDGGRPDELIPGYRRSRPPYISGALQELWKTQGLKTQVILPPLIGSPLSPPSTSPRSSPIPTFSSSSSVSSIAKLEREDGKSKNIKMEAFRSGEEWSAVKPLDKKREANLRWRHFSRLLKKTIPPLDLDERSALTFFSSASASYPAAFDPASPAMDLKSIHCRGTSDQSSSLQEQTELINPGRLRFDRKERFGVWKTEERMLPYRTDIHIPSPRFIRRLYSSILARSPIMIPCLPLPLFLPVVHSGLGVGTAASASGSIDSKCLEQGALDFDRELLAKNEPNKNKKQKEKRLVRGKDEKKGGAEKTGWKVRYDQAAGRQHPPIPTSILLRSA